MKAKILTEINLSSSTLIFEGMIYSFMRKQKVLKFLILKIDFASSCTFFGRQDKPTHINFT